jgi:hypothetical protein
MSLTALILQLSVCASVVTTQEVSYFPGSYFDSEARVTLQRKVMETWPGPSGLLALWRSGDLGEEQKVAVLLGGAAFHHPKLYPIYLEAVRSESERLRQAGYYGYRNLIGDRLPNVRQGVDREAAEHIGREIRMMWWTSRIQPLVATWLQSLMDSEGLELPGYRGASLPRPALDCLRAVETLMTEDDVELLIRAYRTSESSETRFSLMRLIEALTLSSFVEIPKGHRTAWGQEVFDAAVDRFESWLSYWADERCRISSWRMIRASFEGLGLRGVNPTGRDECILWQHVLKENRTAWWSLASRRLYECGGPWRPLDVFAAESPKNGEIRQQILKWFDIEESVHRNRQGDRRPDRPRSRPPGTK